MAVLIVLLLLALTLALGYAGVRSQGIVAQLQRNNDRAAAARQAAQTAVAIGIKRMSTTGWAGVDTSINGTLPDGSTYTVTYTTGDPSLTSASADYSDYPWRVTLLATGSMADPSNTQCVSTYKVRAVMRLVPRQLQTEPTYWSEVTARTMYQWNWGGAIVNSPFRVEGNVLIQGTLSLNYDQGWDDAPRGKYLTDLNAMRLVGRPDYRPFTGRVELPYWWQYGDTRTLLTTNLGVTTADTSFRNSIPSGYPSSPNRYQLYPGGKFYTIPTLPSELTAGTYGPDPLTNPLNIRFRADAVRLRDDVTYRGTIITGGAGGELLIYGKRITLEAVNLPALYGSPQAVQIPVAYLADDFEMSGDVSATINGWLGCNDEFRLLASGQNQLALTLTGGLACRILRVDARNEWVKNGGAWNGIYNSFDAQEDQADGIKYFPDWLLQRNGLNSTPRLLIKPPTTPVRYHWHNPNDPIYVAHTDDGGLRWELADWVEGVD